MGYVHLSSYLEIKNIKKSYKVKDDHLRVIDGLELEISRNEFVSIIGASGCGKSTLLKLIAGFIEPEEGQIVLNNNEIRGASFERIMVFQEFDQLFPWKTILENVYFALKAKDLFTSKRKRIEVAKEYLKEVQLNKYFDYYPHQLSGGMKQRAALARSLVTKPSILLMDEPFGSLDSQTRRELQNLLLEIWYKERNTVIFVTHDIKEAVILSDKIIVMDDQKGQIKEIIQNNLNRPRRPYGHDFIELFQKLNRLI